MAVETVELNAGDNQSQVAYAMANSLWLAEHNENPKMSDAKFYELVHECWRCLSYRGPGKFTDEIGK